MAIVENYISSFPTVTALGHGVTGSTSKSEEGGILCRFTWQHATLVWSRHPEYTPAEWSRTLERGRATLAFLFVLVCARRGTAPLTTRMEVSGV